MKKNILLILMVAVLTILAACGSSEAKSEDTEATGEKETTGNVPEESEEVTIKHELGEAVVKKNPKNVVVFDFGALDILDTLGVKVSGVAKGSTLPGYLSKFEADEYVNVGSLKEPDFETIYGMEPELIVISGRQSAAYEDLSEIAPTIYIGIDNKKYMESFKKNVETLAKIFEKEELAEKELANINNKIEEVKKVTADQEKTGLVTLTTGGKLSAYGPESRFGIVHDVFGVKAADENIETSGHHGMKVSFEYISETNPDFLFIIDRDAVVGGDTNAKEVFNNALVNKTTAAQNDKLIYLDPAVWYLSSGGISSTAKQVDEVLEGIK